MIATRTCKVDMTVFQEDPFNFVQGDEIKARITAANPLGEGTESFVSQTVVAQVQTVPLKPSSTVYVDQINTNSEQIALKWNALVGEEDGGSDVLLYNVQWDQGTSEMVYSLQTTSALAYTVTSAVEGLIGGYPYQFRYRAKNKHGWGEYSETSTFNAASIPSQVDPVVTKIENSFAKIEWEYPVDGAAEITEYEIQIKQKDGEYRSEDYYCNGA